MADANKTQPTDASVEAFLADLEPARRREDAAVLNDLMRRVTGETPVIWGENIVGFGTYSYHYKSGRKGDWLRTGFSPRKTALSVYIMPGFEECQDMLAKLGKHKTSVSCLYINKLTDVDMDVLEQVVRHGLQRMDALYPS